MTTPPQPRPTSGKTDRAGLDGAGIGRALTGLGRFLAGTGDLRVFWWSWTAQAVIVFVITLLDAQARLRDAAISNLLEPLWRPFTDELSSGAIIVLAFPALCRMALAFPPWGAPIGRFLGVHAVGAAVFSAVHVAGFIVLRLVAYGLFGELYRFGGLGQFLYELPRDVTTYGLTAGGVWGVGILLQAGEARARPVRASFDIRDNGRIVRAPIDEIVAVRSAGNYVEFLLADGRRPLMRATLAQMAERLAAHGFVRTHRSWLVNKARIAQIDPAGSGDFRIALSGGVEAPLSRRFRRAVELG
jgi:hypothetical protein